MSEHRVHRWFESTTGTTLTSHNGWCVLRKTKPGTLKAFRDAHANGYRWMQIDAIPIKGDLISGHTLLGLRPGLRNKTIAEIRQNKRMSHVALVKEVLCDEALTDVYWNIEIKSKEGVPRLLDLLGELATEKQRDLRSILVSSPLRPSTLRAVAAAYRDVALAAPLIHGGVLGVRFLGKQRALVNGKPYDCQQCWHRIIRSPAAKGDRPLRQLWTIGSRKLLHRGADKEAHMIVDSARVDLPLRDTARISCEPLGDKRTTMLALGGGGWRGAYGGVGTVLYLAHQKRWADVGQVVGISGGAFVVAALSAEPADVDPAKIMSPFFKKLQRASGTIGKVVVAGIALAVPVVGVVGVALRRAWTKHSWWAVAGIVVTVMFTAGFLVRSFITAYWKMVLRGLYGNQTMRDTSADGSEDRLVRCCRIGATGMSDGNLYSYTTNLVGDRDRWNKLVKDGDVRWDRNHSIAIPVPLDRDKNDNPVPRKLTDAVLRATSLPGVGQWGARKICLADHARRDHDDTCRVPDRLVDGGVSGIFGRGLIEPPDGAGAKPTGFRAPVDLEATDISGPTQIAVVEMSAGEQLVIVDAGRALQLHSDRSVRDRAWSRVEGISTLVLLARWLSIALDVAYRGELKRVADGELAEGYGFRLVRLAEEERKRLRKGPVLNDDRQLQLNRLTLLRDRVHSFSLLKGSRGWACRSVTVAVAACALEFNEEHELESILEGIGAQMAANDPSVGARDLADVWKKVAVLGQPRHPTTVVEEKAS